MRVWFGFVDDDDSVELFSGWTEDDLLLQMAQHVDESADRRGFTVKYERGADDPLDMNAWGVLDANGELIEDFATEEEAKAWVAKTPAQILEESGHGWKFDWVDWDTGQRDTTLAHAAELIRPHEPALANEIEHGCLHLHPGEPFFVLRAQDRSAPAVVDHWALLNTNIAGPQKIAAAHDVADRMRKWSGPRKDAD